MFTQPFAPRTRLPSAESVGVQVHDVGAERGDAPRAVAVAAARDDRQPWHGGAPTVRPCPSERCTMWNVPGVASPRCGSFANIGLPLRWARVHDHLVARAVRAVAPARRRRSVRAARAAAASVDGASGAWPACLPPSRARPDGAGLSDINALSGIVSNISRSSHAARAVGLAAGGRDQPSPRNSAGRGRA